MKKLLFYTEVSYLLGLLLLAFGTALTAYGGFGISMVVAPAYVLHLFLSQFFPFFTFGMAEYTLQAIILLSMMLILRKAKLTYLLSFGVAILYGFALDGAMQLTAYLPEQMLVKVIAYVVGAIICCGAIALLFCSYLPPAAYEMFVKEAALKWSKPLDKIKTLYDMASLAVAVILSLAFFGTLRGIGIGTVACTFVYGFLIRIFQKLYHKFFRFEDKLPWRDYFEESEKTE